MDYPWRLKTKRAAEHLDTFASESQRYIESSNVGFRFDVDETTGVITCRMDADAEPPARLGMIVGDVLQNLRSALDAIAWETCKRAGLSGRQERQVYFPVVLKSEKWEESAARLLPRVPSEQVLVFEELQPWFHRKRAAEVGVELAPDSDTWNPLYRLNELASQDRHRVPHPILARADQTWIGTPEGVHAEALVADPPPWSADSVMLRWRITPAERVGDVAPAGKALLALSEDGALGGESALAALKGMQQSVLSALRRIEVEVLGVVTAQQMAELAHLQGEADQAEERMRELRGDIIDDDYIVEHRKRSAALSHAQAASAAKWRELFD